MSRPGRARHERILPARACWAIYAASSRLDGTPYFHMCELPIEHVGWCICWCGCAFTSRGVVGYRTRLDLGIEFTPQGSHVPSRRSDP